MRRPAALALVAWLAGCGLTATSDPEPVAWSAAPADARIWETQAIARARQAWSGVAVFDLYPQIFTAQAIGKHAPAREAFVKMNYIALVAGQWTFTDRALRSSTPCATPYVETDDCRRFVLGRVVDIRPTTYLFNPDPYPNKGPARTLTFDYRIDPSTQIGKALAASGALACAHGKRLQAFGAGGTTTETLFAAWHASTRCDESITEFADAADFKPIGPSLPF